MNVRLPFVIALLLAAGAVRAQAIDVKVQAVGERILVDVSAKVAVRRAVAWDVLTDYEHMASFVSSLKSSSVLSRQGDTLQVEQSGEAHRAFLHFSFSTIRAVELMPEREIRSSLVRGEFKAYAFTTLLSGEDHGPTLISHHGDYIPTQWVPPVVGPALIEAETRKQYADLIAEMVRRQAGIAAAPK